MRIRTIKPEFWTHRMHKVISEPAALLAAALICYPDDEGRFEADPVSMTRELFPRRPLSIPLEQALQELVEVGFVVLYPARLDKVATTLGQVCHFRRHQVISKATKSRLPAPPTERHLESNSGPENDAAPIPLPDDSMTTPMTTPIPLPDDSSPTPCGRKEGRERKGKEGKEGSLSREREEFFSPTLEEVRKFSAEKKIPPAAAEKWFFEMDGVGWRNRFDQPVTNWRSFLLGYARNWREKTTLDPALGPLQEAGDDPAWWTERVGALEETLLALYASGNPANLARGERLSRVLTLRRHTLRSTPNGHRPDV